VKARIAAFDAAADAWFDQFRGNPVFDRVLYGASALGDFSLLWHLAGATEGLRGNERKAVTLAAALGVESVLVNGVVKSFFRRDRPAWDQHRHRRINDRSRFAG